MPADELFPQLKPIVAEPPAIPQSWDLWSRANLGEVMPGPVSALAWSHFGEMMNDSARRTYRILGVRDIDRYVLFRLIDGFMYLNAGAFLHLLRDRLGLPASFFTMTIGQGASRLAEHETPTAPWRAYAQLGPRLLRLIESQREDLARLRRLQQPLRAEAARYTAMPLNALDADELLDHYDALARLVVSTMPLHLEITTASFGLFGTLEGMLHQLGIEDVSANDLVTGILGVASAEISIQLWRIATSLSVAAYEALAAPAGWSTIESLATVPGGERAASQIRDFLAEYGHRAADELELASPRWADDPTFVLGTIRSYATAYRAGRPGPPDLLRRQVALRQWAIGRVQAQLASRTLDRPFGQLRALFEHHLRQTAVFVRWRENGKHELLRPLHQLRRVAVAIGQRLVERRELDSAEDVFNLRVEELRAAVRGESSGWAEVARHRGRLRTERLGQSPPDLRGPDLQPLHAQASSNGELSGTAASRGIVQGRARVLRSIAESDLLQPGEILVASITDPGWTPLFGIASAVLVERGGLLSHGAIVAREYGIPAVIGIPGLLDRVETGMLLEVDGTAGRVTILEGATGDGRSSARPFAPSQRAASAR